MVPRTSLVLVAVLYAIVYLVAGQTQALTGTRVIPSLQGETSLRKIATKIAPLIYVHSQDPYRPSSVDYFVRHFGQSAKTLANKQTYRFVADQKLALNYKDKGWLKGPKDSKNWPAYVYISPNVTNWPCAVAGDLIHDIVYWAFYPFNGGKITKKEEKYRTLKLGPSGDHVGDWEGLALRVLIHEGQVSIVEILSTRHNSPLTIISTPQEANLDWADDNGKVSSTGTHPVYYSAWQGHSMYPHPGCYWYGGPNVDFAYVVNQVLAPVGKTSLLSGKEKAALSKLPILDASVYDFADKGPGWFTWRRLQFVEVDGVVSAQHKWWWTKTSWFWGNSRTPGIHFVSLTGIGLINKLLVKLANKVCMKTTDDLMVEIFCGLSNGPRAPRLQVAGMKANIGPEGVCQPPKRWNYLVDGRKLKPLAHQCKDGALLSEGKKDKKKPIWKKLF